MTPGSLRIAVNERSIDLMMVGGAEWSIPVGPQSLVERELERATRPAPEQLTNALGIVIDHLDDVVRESPMVMDAPSVTVTGDLVVMLARVELGADAMPDGYRLQRADADEVFRTLVAEPIDERIHNPGLDASHVELIIGTCCATLAIMRRLELTSIGIEAG
ncbi:MAG: hypothetical protein AB8G14_17770 [Ilumatobacter sp.]